MKDSELYNMFKEVIELNKEKYSYLKTETEKIINNKIKDEKYIEGTLDKMLDVLFSYETEETLLSFKKLCRYYYEINPEATADYIKTYKEMTESDENLDIIKQ